MAATKLNERELARLRAQIVERITALYHTVQGDVRAGVHEAFLDPEAHEPGDEGDESAQLQQRDLQLRLDERDAQLAQALEAALRRIRLGDYGECVDCGSEIEPERLRALPWTQRCIECQEVYEAEQHARPPTL